MGFGCGGEAVKKKDAEVKHEVVRWRFNSKLENVGCRDRMVGIRG